jgi:nucleotide-binding universal stress UspA family protein
VSNLEFKLEPMYTVSFLFRRILVPVDGSENSLRALSVALDFAQRYGSRVTVLHVASGSAEIDALRKTVEKKAQEKGVDVEFKVRMFNPQISSISNEIINEIISGGYDLVIMGARGSTTNEDIILGSTALSIAVNSAASIMIIR